MRILALGETRFDAYHILLDSRKGRLAEDEHLTRLGEAQTVSRALASFIQTSPGVEANPLAPLLRPGLLHSTQCHCPKGPCRVA